VLKASGHEDTFTDPMLECAVCRHRYRADQLSGTTPVVETFAVSFFDEHDQNVGTENISVGGSSAEDTKRKARIQIARLKPPLPLAPRMQQSKVNEERDAQRISCLECGAELTDPRQFNLMFQTNVGASLDSDSIAYLRPETAQSIFVQFKNVLDTARKKLPFGIAQIGKAFRNEINPRNYIFRSREFEQMELEYFCRPEQGMELLEYWKEERIKFYENIGIPRAKLHLLTVPDADRAFYSKGTYDIEYDFPFGRQELEGVAYRTDYDLKQHQEASGKPLDYFDEETKQRFIPHVVEPSAGVDRTVLALLCNAYDEETVTDEKGKSETRIVMRFHPRMAPVKVGVFPLLKNNEQLVSKAREIVASLRAHRNVFYDETGAIGRRYRRQDEAGTPFGVTVDFETLGEKDAALRDTVTLRERDSMKQERVKIGDLLQLLLARIA
jgi:glycyl-tRNA synthetase